MSGEAAIGEYMRNCSNVIYDIPECESVIIKNVTTNVSDTFPYVGDFGYPLTRGPGKYAITARMHDGTFVTYFDEVKTENMETYTTVSNAFVDTDMSKLVQVGRSLNTIEQIYAYVYHKIKYDYIKAFTLKKSKLYRPDILKIDEEKKGICWDKTCFFAALCRASRIPCQICVGDLTIGLLKEYHAWCRVKVDGKWKTVDPTNGTKYKVNAYTAKRFF